MRISRSFRIATGGLVLAGAVVWLVVGLGSSQLRRDPGLRLLLVQDAGGAGLHSRGIGWSPDLDGDGAAELVVLRREEYDLDWKRLWRDWTLEYTSFREVATWIGSAKGDVLHTASAEDPLRVQFERGAGPWACVHARPAAGPPICLAPHVCQDLNPLREAPQWGLEFEQPFQPTLRIGDREFRVRGFDGGSKLVDADDGSVLTTLRFPEHILPKLAGSERLAAAGIGFVLADRLDAPDDADEALVLYEVAPDRDPVLRRWSWRGEELPFWNRITEYAAALGADGVPRIVLRSTRPDSVRAALFIIEITRDGEALVRDPFHDARLIGQPWAEFCRLESGILALDAGFSVAAPHDLALHVLTERTPSRVERLPYAAASFRIPAKGWGVPARTGEQHGVHDILLRPVPDQDGDGLEDCCFVLRIVGGGWRSTVVRGFLSGATGELLTRNPRETGGD